MNASASVLLWIFAGVIFVGEMLNVFLKHQKHDGDRKQNVNRTFHGLNRNDISAVLSMLCDIEDRIELTQEESDAYDIAIQCVTQIHNRMLDGKGINWD